MTEREFAEAYDSLSRKGQVLFLARLFHGLTITTRGHYSIVPQIVNSNPESPIGNLNEIQHRVAGVLNHILIDESDHITGIDLLNLLFDWAKRGRIESELLFDIETAMSYTKRNEEQ